MSKKMAIGLMVGVLASLPTTAAHADNGMWSQAGNGYKCVVASGQPVDGQIMWCFDFVKDSKRRIGNCYIMYVEEWKACAPLNTKGSLGGKIR